MKKALHFTLLTSFVLGNILLLMTRLFGDKLTDFVLGFFVGIGIVLTLAGTTYLVHYAVKKKYISSYTKKQ